MWVAELRGLLPLASSQSSYTYISTIRANLEVPRIRKQGSQSHSDWSKGTQLSEEPGSDLMA